MKKFILAGSALLFLYSPSLSSAQSPTPAYTCKKTCTTQNICDVPATGSDNGTCPRAEICCAYLTTPITPGAPTPAPTPTIKPLRYDCDQTTNQEYHPLRPYIASPCASELIPRKIPEAPDTTNKKYLTFSCGKSANPGGNLTSPDVVMLNSIYDTFPAFDNLVCPGAPDCTPYIQANFRPSHQSDIKLCDPPASSDGAVCFLAKIVYDVTLDYSEAIFPILGNTKDIKLSDRTKVNNYLSWYLNGAVLQSEGKNLVMSKATDNDRLINFSGPVLKLLSKESLTSLRQTLQDNANDTVHNYYVSRGSSVRIAGSPTESFNGSSTLPSLFEFASEEDITGEVMPSLMLEGQPTSPDIDGQIVSIGLSLGGNADSRLYFPHLKNTNALSEYLTSTYKPVTTPPIPTTAEPQRQKNLVTQLFTQYQGINDNTLTTYGLRIPDYLTGTYTTRNTEVIPGYPAPTPLFTNYSDRFPSVVNQVCDISNANPRPGDILVGSKIPATLTIFQAFRYNPQRLVINTGATSGQCINLNLTPSSTPTSCKNYPDGHDWPYWCSSLSGESCVGDWANGQQQDGSCCWGQCPYFNSCELAGYKCCSSPGPDACGPNYSTLHPELSCSPNKTYDVCVGPDPILEFGCITANPYPIDCAVQCSSFTDSASCGTYCCHWGQTGSHPASVTPKNPTCPLWPDKGLKSSSRIAIFVKTPYVERIYETLVAAPDSLLRRFLPLGGGIPQPTPGPIVPAPPPNYVGNCLRDITKSGATCAECPDQDNLGDCQSLDCCIWYPGATPTPGPGNCLRDVSQSGPTCTECQGVNNQTDCQSLVCCTWYPAAAPTPVREEFLKVGKKALPGAGIATYVATASSLGAPVTDVKVTAGNGGAPTLYYPKIGSMFEYLLGAGTDPFNLQCLFRPQGTCNQTAKSGNYIGTCPASELANMDRLGILWLPNPPPLHPRDYLQFYTWLESAYPSNTHVDTGKIPDPTAVACLAEYADRNWPGNQFRDHLNQTIDWALAHGWNPSILMSIWLEESHAGQIGKEYGCGAQGVNPADQLQCLETVTLNVTFSRFMCLFAGDCPDNDTQDTNPSFMAVTQFYNILTIWHP